MSSASGRWFNENQPTSKDHICPKYKHTRIVIAQKSAHGRTRLIRFFDSLNVVPKTSLIKRQTQHILNLSQQDQRLNSIFLGHNKRLATCKNSNPVRLKIPFLSFVSPIVQFTFCQAIWAPTQMLPLSFCFRCTIRGFYELAFTKNKIQTVTLPPSTNLFKVGKEHAAIKPQNVLSTRRKLETSDSLFVCV